jgi:hypothetical protein
MYPCHLDSYVLEVKERENPTVMRRTTVSSLPFEMTGLKPYTNYAWMVVHFNKIIYEGKLRTHEGGKLKLYFLKYKLNLWYCLSVKNLRNITSCKVIC